MFFFWLIYNIAKLDVLTTIPFTSFVNFMYINSPVLLGGCKFGTFFRTTKHINKCFGGVGKSETSKSPYLFGEFLLGPLVDPGWPCGALLLGAWLPRWLKQQKAG